MFLKSKSMDTKQIIQKYISIIAIVFFIFLVGRIYYDTMHKQMMIDDQTQKYYQSLDAVFENSEELLIKNYTLLAKHFMNSKIIAQYIKNNERESLQNLLEQDYEEFKIIDPNLFVMHFFDQNNKTILRMHKPSSFGDDLTQKRPIVAYANKSLKQQNAFEVGKNGIVYRVSSPFFHQNEHIGLLEFGIKLDFFTQVLEKKFDIQTAQLVKTDQLDILIAKKQYPQIEDFSVVAKDSVFGMTPRC